MMLKIFKELTPERKYVVRMITYAILLCITIVAFWASARVSFKAISLILRSPSIESRVSKLESEVQDIQKLLKKDMIVKE
jgi:hypothetical protein